MFTEEQVQALRDGPTHELGGEELWAAHGGWVITLAIRVVNYFPRLHLRRQELWGSGYMALVSAAKYWRQDRGAGFTAYSYPIIIGRMCDQIYQQCQDTCPRPKSYRTQDPNLGVVYIDEIESRHESGDPSALQKLKEIQRALDEGQFGNIDLFSLNPDDVQDACKGVVTLENYLKPWRESNQAAKRSVADRIEAVVLDEQTYEEAAQSLNRTRQAVGTSIRRMRFDLKHLLGSAAQSPTKANIMKGPQPFGRTKKIALNRLKRGTT